MVDEIDSFSIPLSALQHAVYCLRQAALIHLERQWAENRCKHPERTPLSPENPFCAGQAA